MMNESRGILKMQAMHVQRNSFAKQGSSRSSLNDSEMTNEKHSNNTVPAKHAKNCVNKPKRIGLVIQKVLDHLSTHVAQSL